MKLLALILSLLTIPTSQLTIDTQNSLNETFDMMAAIKCRGQNGKYIKAGFARTFTCVKLYKDAKKKCTSSTECQGGCIVTNQAKPQGFCKASSIPFGCYSTIEDWNQKHGIICRD